MANTKITRKRPEKLSKNTLVRKVIKEFREIRNEEFLEAQKCRFREKFQKLPENAKRN